MADSISITDRLRIISRATEKAEQVREELATATAIFREVLSGARAGDASFERTTSTSSASPCARRSYPSWKHRRR